MPLHPQLSIFAPVILRRMYASGWGVARRNWNRTVHITVGRYLAHAKRWVARFWFAYLKRFPRVLKTRIKLEYDIRRAHLFTEPYNLPLHIEQVNHSEMLVLDEAGRIHAEEDPFDI